MSPLALLLIKMGAEAGFALLEKALPSTGAGPTRMQKVFGFVKDLLGTSAAAGNLGGPAPSDDSVKAELQRLFNESPYAKQSAQLIMGGKTFNVVLTVVNEVKTS